MCEKKKYGSRKIQLSIPIELVQQLAGTICNYVFNYIWCDVW
jgi:hypothetical protein